MQRKYINHVSGAEEYDQVERPTVRLGICLAPAASSITDAPIPPSIGFLIPLMNRHTFCAGLPIFSSHVEFELTGVFFDMD
jgi:hypothetical protein